MGEREEIDIYFILYLIFVTVAKKKYYNMSKFQQSNQHVSRDYSLDTDERRDRRAAKFYYGTLGTLWVGRYGILKIPLTFMYLHLHFVVCAELR